MTLDTVKSVSVRCVYEEQDEVSAVTLDTVKSVSVRCVFMRNKMRSMP